MNYDLVVIGGGPAGLGAAVEARKNGVEKILIIERDRELGGILNQCIHNGFGVHEFKEELTGPEYATRFIEMVEEMEIEYLLNTMVLNIDEDKNIMAIGEDNFYEISAKSIILSMGCRERARGGLDLPGYRPAGVFTAGAAQRFVNMEGYMVGKKIIIYGSGDIGLIMARRMTLEGAEVVGVVERKRYSSGLNRNIVQCLNDFDIPLLLNHAITYVHGKDRVKGVTIVKTDQNKQAIKGSEKFIECDTLLLSVGLIPENELSLDMGVELDRKTSGPIVNNKMQTNIEGVFACGNVVHVHDLVDFVTKESKIAGRNAALYIQGKFEEKKERLVKTKAKEGIVYVMPHYIDANSEEEINIFMRVKDVYTNKKLIMKSGEEVIYEKKYKHMIPSEMINFKLSKEQLKKIDVNIEAFIEEV